MKFFSIVAAIFSGLAMRAWAETIVLRNVSILDMVSAQIQSGMAIRIQDDVIQNVYPVGVEQDEASEHRVIDAEGKYVMPGLWDMHVHFSYYGEEALGLLVGHGVLGARDPGCNLIQIDGWRDEIKRRERIGPNIIRSGPFIDGPKTLSPLRASFTRIVRTELEGRAIARELKGQGVDFLKTHSRLPREAFFGVADEARKLDIPLVVHVAKDVSAWEAIQAGARSIEHTESFLGESIYLEPQALMESRVLEAFEAILSSGGRERMAKIADRGVWVTPTLIAHVRGFENHESTFWRAFPDRLFQVLKLMVDAGVPLLAGSDFNFPSGKIQPGVDLHSELALFVKAGLSPFEALKTATVNPAEALGIAAMHGTLEVGKKADLVLLEANPIEDINNTRNVSAVVLDGVFLDESQLATLRKGSETSN